jgi:hypothetical protein
LYAESNIFSAEYPRATSPLSPIKGALFYVTKTIGALTLVKLVFEKEKD